jgi:hypothetical protein
LPAQQSSENTRLNTGCALPLAHTAFLCARVRSIVRQGEPIMNINFIYDASVNSAPAAFKTALNTVGQELSQAFADPITINIRVGWGFFNGHPVPPNEVRGNRPNYACTNPADLRSAQNSVNATCNINRGCDCHQQFACQ